MSVLRQFVRNYWLLLAIFVVALILRTYNLGGIPTGLHEDEASIGYTAYSLLKTAHDQNGNFLPITIDQFGDFRPPGYHYLAIPFVALLGLTEFATRLPAAIFGAATIFAFYLLLLEIFGNKRIGIIGAGLLAVSPWHIVISRATSEGVIAAFFIILGSSFLIKGYKKKQNSLPVFIVSFLFFLISFMFYHSARFFVPAFIVPLLILLALQYKLPNKTKILSLGALGILLIAGLFLLLTLGKGEARPLTISIFNFPMARLILNNKLVKMAIKIPMSREPFTTNSFTMEDCSKQIIFSILTVIFFSSTMVCLFVTKYRGQAISTI